MPKPVKRKTRASQRASQIEKPSIESISTAVDNEDGPEDADVQEESAEEEEEGEEDTEDPEETPVHHHHHHHHGSKKLKKKLYQSRRAVFVLGALLGLVLTAFITSTSNQRIRTEIDKLIQFDSKAFFADDWRDMLPSGLLSILQEYDSKKEEADPSNLKGSTESFSVGKRMQTQYNLTSKYNVIMVPGVISTGLESWGLSEDGDCPSINHFRKRLWGSFYMLRTMILDKACWLKHVKLDPHTGMDPPNIRLRAAQGFESSDFFVAGYWIWNKILQNLAVIGYGPNNMITASYDWRLAYLDLEKRDGYFSKLKSQIELNKKFTGEKSILVGHSMGSQVIYYFMKWVEAKGPHYGNGGNRWVNDHIGAFVDISGSILGTPKTIPVLISGEMKDTVQMNQLAIYGLEKFFSRKERVDMARTFGGVPGMLPKGGDLIWGNLTHSPDDPTNSLLTNLSDFEIEGPHNESLGTFIRFDSKKNKAHNRNFTIQNSIDFILELAPEWFSNRVRSQYSFGVAETASQLSKNNHDHSKWSNPLEAALPYAPDMRIFCFYGVGNPTERAYTYTDAEKGSHLPMTIDLDNENPIYMSDGDGTVSLLTHAMCHEWQKQNSRFNPARINTTIVEIKHEPDRFDIRGGAKTAEHVDILGSSELNELVLKVAAGEGYTIPNRYVSDLKEMVEHMNI